MEHWVKALRICRVPDVHGHLKTYQPGDWFAMQNKAMLRQWVAQGKVERLGMDYSNTFDLSDCGIVVRGPNAAEQVAYIKHNTDLEARAGGLELPYPRTLLWETAGALRLDLIPTGFHRLEAGWQIAAPLWKYAELARDTGSVEDKQRTEGVIRDLRVPLYDVRLLYVRRCPNTERWLERFKVELEHGNDKKHALLRSLYLEKPVVCALPTVWMEGVRFH